jgi:hypothetical protein
MRSQGAGRFIHHQERQYPKLVQPLSVVNKSDISPTHLTFPLEAPYASFSKGNGSFASFQTRRMLHELTGVLPPVLSRCFAPCGGPITVLPSREQRPRCIAGFSPAPQTIARPAVSPPLPPRVEGQHLQMSRPWGEVKSRRGARHPGKHRRVCLSSPAVPVLRDHRCSRPRLVGDGTHGRAERIQTFRGLA